MRAARKPSAVARELLRNFPKAGGRRRRRKRKGTSQDGGSVARNGKAAKATCVVPLRTAWMAGPAPENGTWVISIPPTILKSSPERCGVVPIPGLA